MKEVNKTISPEDAASFIKKSIELNCESNISADIVPVYANDFDLYTEKGPLVVVINNSEESKDLGMKQKNFHLLAMFKWDSEHHNYERIRQIEEVLPELGKTYTLCHKLILQEMQRLKLDSENEESSNLSNVQRKQRLKGQRTAKGKKVATPDAPPTGKMDDDFVKDRILEEDDFIVEEEDSADEEEEEEEFVKVEELEVEEDDEEEIDDYEEIKSQFLELILTTKPMIEAKKLIGPSLSNSDWRALVNHHWFHPYSTNDMKKGTGFDFNFIGEIREGKVGTYHFWFKCLIDELYGHHHMGYVDQEDTHGNPHYLEFKTKIGKSLSSFFVGMSPETYLSIGMVLYYTKQGTIPFDVYKDTFEFVHEKAGKKKEYIHTITPQLPQETTVKH
mmetsp:Transcript_10867/g.15937  ORF Transcript_10867/g.15937 Transcript_10867/m.15937 type:complete len:390 (+) Transcript_10867:871-2040(+)